MNAVSANSAELRGFAIAIAWLAPSDTIPTDPSRFYPVRKRERKGRRRRCRSSASRKSENEMVAAVVKVS